MDHYAIKTLTGITVKSNRSVKSNEKAYGKGSSDRKRKLYDSSYSTVIARIKDALSIIIGAYAGRYAGDRRNA